MPGCKPSYLESGAIISDPLLDFWSVASLAKAGVKWVGKKIFAKTASKLGKEGGKVAAKVWSKPPVVRGEVIEKALGQNLPQTFKVIDKFKNGVATSIKSLDLNAKTYQSSTKLYSKLRNYVDKVAGFKKGRMGDVIIKEKDVKKRALDLAIPGKGNPAQQAVLKRITDYAKSKGVEVNVIVVK